MAPPWEALARGADLFNRGLHWEAHEAWEELWLALDDEPRLFVQGLIQVAAAGHKAFVQRQPRGCVKLLTTALDKLVALGKSINSSPILSKRIDLLHGSLGDYLNVTDVLDHHLRLRRRCG